MLEAPVNNRFLKEARRCGVFHRFAKSAARATGHGFAFGIAVGAVLAWAISGPLFHFNDTWQLTINTATTIITFLMVFLIQNSQNRESEAVQLKLDEIIRASKYAHNAILNIEELTESELDKIKKKYALLAEAALKEVRAGKSDLGSPQLDRKERRPHNGRASFANADPRGPINKTPRHRDQ
jgi:low affinity Fe/Cu permease